MIGAATGPAWGLVRICSTEHFDHYPPNDGAVRDGKILYDSPEAFMRDYGYGPDHAVGFDRLGDENGKYLGVKVDDQPSSFESRGLPISSLTKPYFEYMFTGKLPAGWHIEISEAAPAFGREGGAYQVRVFDERNIELRISELKEAKVIK